MCLAVGTTPARLTSEVPALLFHAASYLAFMSWFSGARPWAKCADPRGRVTWEVCWLSRFLSTSSLIDSRNYVRSNADWHNLPVLVGKGEKISTDYVCRTKGRGHLSSCGATWGPIAKIRENWSIDGIPLAPGIFYSATENSRWLSCHLSMIYCKKSSFYTFSISA